jgi:hypothetical protein
MHSGLLIYVRESMPAIEIAFIIIKSNSMMLIAITTTATIVAIVNLGIFIIYFYLFIVLTCREIIFLIK